MFVTTIDYENILTMKDSINHFLFFNHPTGLGEDICDDPMIDA